MSPAGRPLRAVTIALGIGVVLGLMHIVCVTPLHVPFDPNEGWNATFAQAAMATGSPYPPAASLMVDNYPPLSFYLVGALATVTGDAVIAGRIVALAALFATLLGIEAAARAMGCTRLESLFAALFFAAWVMASSDYAGMDDPQMLGHAIAMGGLVLALREPRTPRGLVFAAALFTLAFFVKHNLVVLPAAVAVWLALLDRRLAATFVLSGLAFALIGLGVFRQAFGISLSSVIDTPRGYDAASIWAGLEPWLAWSALPLAGAAALFAVARRDRFAVFCVLYAGLGTLAGIYFLGGAGVDANALFDADIALALCGALLIGRTRQQGAIAALYAVPLALGLWSLDAAWWRADYWLHPMAAERVAAAQEIALLRAAPGPAICEMPSLCYWAGKPATVDVFNIAQAYRTGARSDAPLAAALRGRRYAVVQLEELAPFPLTPGIARALFANYRIAQRDGDRVLFVPKP